MPANSSVCFLILTCFRTSLCSFYLVPAFLTIFLILRCLDSIHIPCQRSCLFIHQLCALYVKIPDIRTMHSSYFDYKISRPYPFKWFTPVVIIGGAVAVVLLSILNLGSSGYTLAARYSHDPNATVSVGRSQYWPSLPTIKPHATCQSANTPVNTRLFTNNTALTYPDERIAKGRRSQSDVLIFAGVS